MPRFDFGPYITSDYAGSPIVHHCGNAEFARLLHEKMLKAGLSVNLSGPYVSLLDERQVKQFREMIKEGI
jgi:hypothetical protein